MKPHSLFYIIMLSILCLSCNPGSKTKDPYAGQTIETNFGQESGIEAYAGYSYIMGSLITNGIVFHVYQSDEKGEVAFITDSERTVIAHLGILYSELKDNQYVNYGGVIEDYDPNREYWNNPYTLHPNYIVIFEVEDEDDFLDKPYFGTVVKAWRFDEGKAQIEEVSPKGLGLVNESYGI